MEQNIPSLMLADHKKIEFCLVELKNNLDSDDALKCFNQLKWTIQKHMFTEENAIFTMFNPQDEDFETTEKLMKDHVKILEILGKLEVAMKTKTNIDFSYFESFFTKHKDFEEELFYPSLDRSLSKKQKKSVLRKIIEKV